MPIATLFLAGLAAVASVALPLLVYYRLSARQKAEMEELVSKIEELLGASAKFLEVREYCEETSREIQRLLGEANKEGNRQRIDQLRRMRDRLDALRVRVVEKTVNLLHDEDPSRAKKRRRHRRPFNTTSPPPQPPQ